MKRKVFTYSASFNTVRKEGRIELIFFDGQKLNFTFVQQDIIDFQSMMAILASSNNVFWDGSYLLSEPVIPVNFNIIP